MLAPIHLIGSMHMAKVLVPLATGCEELEAVTVIDLLRRASIEVVSAGRDARIHQLLRDMREHGKYTAAICAAPRVLADAGLLQGHRATSFPGSLTAAQLDGVHYEETSVVQDGRSSPRAGPAPPWTSRSP